MSTPDTTPSSGSGADAELLAGDTEFGVFYPTGHVIVAFPDSASAATARSALMTGGYDAVDCVHYSASRVAAGTAASISHASIIASLGSSLAVLEQQHQLAVEGCDFLVVDAPTDAETARVMTVVRRGPFKVAHKYHRLAIEDLE
jgi:hypothetical protein